MNIKLTTTEKKLIRKLTRKQLDNLWAIILDNTEEDLTMYCILNEFTKDELDEKIHSDILLYEEILIKPSLMFQLKEDDESIMKTLLTNMNLAKYADAKKSLWRKFNLLENLNKIHSLN